MNHFLIIFAFAFAAFTMACSKPSAPDLSSNPGISPYGSGSPNYSEQALSGKIFSNDWAAVSASVRPVENNSEELFLDIYGEDVSDVCTPQMNLKKPMASLIIPANYKVAEYIYDFSNFNAVQNGNPITFTSYGSENKNVVAEKTKLQIDSLTNSGFDAKLYASITEKEGTISEINGKIFVQDCRKKVEFKVWNDLAAKYSLLSFDGKITNQEYTRVEFDTESRFYDRSTKKYLNVLVFPLYYSVSGNSSAEYNFGPIEGLGTTEVSGETLKYNYKGPLTYKDIDVTIDLSITAVKKDSKLEVQYNIEIPGYITKTSHQFVMKK